jgi:two-component system, cell cycle response regulator
VTPAAGFPSIVNGRGLGWRVNQGSPQLMSPTTRLLVAQRPSQPLEPLCVRLAEAGCELLGCTGYAQAVAALREGGVEIVLIDAWIEDGMALLTQIKSDPGTRHLPVVIAAPDDMPAVGSHALALGADDVLVLPIEDAELFARIRALSRLAAMEVERRRRETVLRQFGVAPPLDMPGVPAIDRIGILLIGPAGGDQIQVMTALGGAATAAYAETAESALERLRRDDLDVALVTGSQDHADLQRLCAAIRSDLALFDLPVLLIGRTDVFPDRALPFDWGVSDVLFQPFQPEVLRLRVQGWVRQQRLRRRLRGCLDGHHLPPTTDRLTRLYGHGFLHGYLEHLIAEQPHTQTPLAVVGFDVAGMSQINRIHGYAAGDRVLAQIGALIARVARAEDLPARLRDDRFCLVIDGTPAAEAASAGERIAEILSDLPLQVGGHTLGVGMLTGAAGYQPGDDAATLVARAFERMAPVGLRVAP